MNASEEIPDCALQHYSLLSSLPVKKEELPGEVRALLEEHNLIKFDRVRGYCLTPAGNRAVRKIEYKIWRANLRRDLPKLGWCSLYATLGFASGFAVLDSLFQSEPPSMLDSIANSNIMKAELASPAITYVSTAAATAVEGEKYKREFKHTLGLNSAIYITGFAAGLMGRALYLVATKK